MDQNLTSLKQLMERENDAKLVERRYKFNNAQIAVDVAYRIAEKSPSALSWVKTPNPLFGTKVKKNQEPHSRYNYAEPTTEQAIERLANHARRLKVEIEKDLNATLSVLEEPKVEPIVLTAPVVEVSHGAETVPA